MITDLIQLRSSMLPYFKSQLDALNETGRPFNRPLMWDFPEDPRTWELAEGGIGDHGSEPTPATMQDGDWVVLAACNASRPWNQRWINTSGTLRLADPAASTRCLILPQSWFRLTWDGVSCILILLIAFPIISLYLPSLMTL
mgnify:CR=1 FL=1